MVILNLGWRSSITQGFRAHILAPDLLDRGGCVRLKLGGLQSTGLRRQKNKSAPLGLAAGRRRGPRSHERRCASLRVGMGAACVCYVVH